jgi:hypothetical protein
MRIPTMLHFEYNYGEQNDDREEMEFGKVPVLEK